MAGPDTSIHRPVLLRETLQELNLQPGLVVVDATVGGAGHAVEILKRILPGGKLLGLDRDPAMLQRAQHRLDSAGLGTPNDYELIHASHAELLEVLADRNLSTVDRLLVDLGLSSDQLADPARGFGFATTGILDMRFDTTQGKPVHAWLNRAEIAEITRVFSEFGEEPQAERIAQAIVEERRKRPLQQVPDLLALLERIVGRGDRAPGKSHPATRLFQALRIQANAELEHLQRFLTQTAPQAVAAGGRLAVITFHSLEDRMTKQALSNREVWESSSRKPIAPRPLEVKMNPRSRSAKLRIGIRADGQIDHISASN